MHTLDYGRLWTLANISPDRYVELYSGLAELMLEANNGAEILLVTESNGDGRYAYAAQDRCNDYCDDVEAVLLNNNNVGGQY